MGQKVLTDSEVLEIVYNSCESFRDSNSDSVSNSDIEIEDMAVTEQKKKSCNIRTFRTLVRSWTYAVDLQLLQQSRISKEAN